jgi:tetratricopeptide (TPR) repeat protein
MASEDLQRLCNMAEEATALEYQGCLDQVERLQRVILDEMTRLKGPEDRATLFSGAKLALTLRCQGHYSEAEHMQRKLVELYTKCYGRDDFDTLEVTRHLVMTYNDEYKHLEAARLATKLLSRQQELFGRSSSPALQTELIVATISSNQGQIEDAAEMRRSVLQQRRNSTDVDHPCLLAHALMGYSQSLKDLGRGSEASGLLKEALEIYESSLGSKSVAFLQCKATLAEVYCSEGRNRDAIEIGWETLRARKEILGEAHPDTISSMNDQASFLALASEWTAAKKEVAGAVKLAKEHLGNGHPQTMSIAYNAAAMYRDMGLTDTAEELAELSFHTAQRIMGVDHQMTLSMMFLYCEIMFQGDNNLTAVRGMRLCVLRTRRTYGEHHPLTLDRENQLAWTEKTYKICHVEEALERNEDC